MKMLIFSFILLIVIGNSAFSQESSKNVGEIVFSNDEVVFRQLDEHTWVGSGNVMWHESLFLIEGNEKAILIDAGTNIEDLDKIVSTITEKPVTLVATHVHPDHTGASINRFPQIYINPGDTVLTPIYMSDYQGVVKYLAESAYVKRKPM